MDKAGQVLRLRPVFSELSRHVTDNHVCFFPSVCCGLFEKALTPHVAVCAAMWHFGVKWSGDAMLVVGDEQLLRSALASMCFGRARGA